MMVEQPEITEEEITALVKNSSGHLNDTFCRYLVFFLIGYLHREEPDNYHYRALRQRFYGQVKQHMEKNEANERQSISSNSTE